jgi:hypothetical protein
MNAKPTKETALDELLRQIPCVDPATLEQVRQATDFLRKLGLLSTEPAEIIRPFQRKPLPKSTSAIRWGTKLPYQPAKR